MLEGLCEYGFMRQPLCISDSLSDYGGKASPSVAGAAMSEQAVPVVHKTKKMIPGD